MGTRAQCIIYRGNRVLLVRHRQDSEEWWCLPGGGIGEGETAGKAALRELKEKCCVDGTIVRETCAMVFAPQDETRTFLVDIGTQEPRLGTDPDVSDNKQVLVDFRWLTLSEIPERDRAFLWAAGLLGAGEFRAQVSRWGESISYPV